LNCSFCGKNQDEVNKIFELEGVELKFTPDAFPPKKILKNVLLLKKLLRGK